MELGGDALYGVLLGIGLSAAAGLRLFVPLLILSAASLTGHADLSGEFEWIGSYPALIGFAVAAVGEVTAYLVPLVDNALDALGAPVAGTAGTVLAASSIVELDPALKWPLALIAGGGVASAVHVLTGGARAASTGATLGLGNPFLAVAEAAGAIAMSLLALAVPVVAVVVAAALLYAGFRVVRRGSLRDGPREPRRT